MKQYAYFSAAIRDGAKLRPQAFTAHSGHSSCAVEAGIEAIGCDLSWSDVDELCAMFPYLRTVVTAAPLGGPTRLFDACWQLNDCNKWPREWIADWLYAEEEKLGFVTVVEIQDTATVSAPSQQVAEACSVQH